MVKSKLVKSSTGNAVDRERWDTYQGQGLCQRVETTRLKHARVESDHIVVPFVSDTMGNMAGDSAVWLCLFACCQAVQETESFVKIWGDGTRADNGNCALLGASSVQARSLPWNVRWDD